MSSINLKKSFKIALAINDMTKEQLALDLGVTKQYLTNVTSGNGKGMSIARLDEVAEKLNFRLWEFLKLADKKA